MARYRRTHVTRPSRASAAALLLVTSVAQAAFGEPLHSSDGSVSGVVVEEVSGTRPIRFRVTWIAWNSGFRTGELRLGDEIIGAGGVRWDHRIREENHAPGAYSESSYWSQLGLEGGDAVTFMVQRDGVDLEVSGTLMGESADTNHRLLFPGGPRALASDGFGSGAWRVWYDDLVERMARAEGRGHGGSKWDSTEAYAAFDRDKDRLAHLVEHYPGAFSETLLGDWKSARASAKGEKVELTAEDLAYRELGEVRRARVAHLGLAVEADLVQASSGDLLDPFPALDPIAGDCDQIAGKVVVFDGVGPQQFVLESGRLHIAIGDINRGFYFGDCLSREMAQIRNAIERYRRSVDHRLADSYRLIGRIRGEPRIVMLHGVPRTGHTFDIVAARVGDAFFIDFSGPPRATHLFVGEEELEAYRAEPPSDEGSATHVMDAFVDAVKIGDEGGWRGLFANWTLVEERDGERTLAPDRAPNDTALDHAWRRSRQLILGEVYDVRVVGASEPYSVLTSKVTKEVQDLDAILGIDEASGGASRTDAAEDAPFVEECRVEIVHVHKRGASYRTFSKSFLNRYWLLQRVDGGPWRVVSVQSL